MTLKLVRPKAADEISALQARNWQPLAVEFFVKSKI